MAQRTAFLYLLPGLLIFALFAYWPLIRTFVLSTQGNDIFGAPSGFVGFDHYAKLLNDSAFGQVLVVTAIFTVITVVPTIALSLGIGLMLHARVRAIRFFRSAFALPFAFSVATASVVFSVFFDYGSGVLNGLLSFIGIDRVNWLTDPVLALTSVAITTIWMNLGYNLLIIAAGLGSVPEDVVEAARLDGATGWKLQRSIILPLLSPQIFFLTITGTIHALQSFGQIHILTKGGPDGATTNLVYSIFKQAFAANNSNFGYASAQAVVLLLIVAIITVVQFGLLERKVFYK